MKKMNKEKFLKTELGGSLQECINDLDIAINRQLTYPYGTIPHEKAEKLEFKCQAQWKVYKMVLNHIYGVEYYFTYTDEYFGVATKDKTDWLFKIKRL